MNHSVMEKEQKINVQREFSEPYERVKKEQDSLRRLQDNQDTIESLIGNSHSLEKRQGKLVSYNLKATGLYVKEDEQQQEQLKKQLSDPELALLYQLSNEEIWTLISGKQFELSDTSALKAFLSAALKGNKTSAFELPGLTLNLSSVSTAGLHQMGNLEKQVAKLETEAAALRKKIDAIQEQASLKQQLEETKHQIEVTAAAIKKYLDWQEGEADYQAWIEESELIGGSVLQHRQEMAELDEKAHELRQKVKSYSEKITSTKQAIEILKGQLKSIKIIIGRNEWYQRILKIRDWKEHDLPLFGGLDESSIDELLKSIKPLLEKVNITVADLYDLVLEVVDTHEQQKQYQSLDLESNGTSITVKTIIFISMINQAVSGKKNIGDTIRLPFYVDEIDSLDDANAQNIHDIALKLGLIPIFASPKGSGICKRLYQLDNNQQGKLEVRRKASDSSKLLLVQPTFERIS